MQVLSVNNNINIDRNRKTPNFGHTFKVSICIKNADGAYTYVNPVQDKKLYKQLNKKVVGMLNEDFITNLRDRIGIPRQVKKVKTNGEEALKQKLTGRLTHIDSDYNQARFVRSAYSNSGLAYIATGVDVPVIDEIIGANGIGVAKNIAKRNNLTPEESGVRDITKKFRHDVMEYVRSPMQLLRSKDDKEIMLRVNFNEIKGKRGGKTKYEMSDFEFHEIQSKTLPQLKPEEKGIKEGRSLQWLVSRYIKHSFDKIYDSTKYKMKPKQAVVAKQNFVDYASRKDTYNV